MEITIASVRGFPSHRRERESDNKSEHLAHRGNEPAVITVTREKNPFVASVNVQSDSGEDGGYRTAGR